MRHGARLTLLGMVLLGCGGDSSGPGPGGDQLVLEVLPADTSITVFGTATYTLVALNGAGDTVPAPAVIWTSSDSGVASITQDGVATGKAAGITNIVATAPEVVSAPARLEVTAGSAACFGIATATAFDGDVAWGFKVVDQETPGGGYFITADDNGNVHARMPLQSPGPFLALWSGELNNASSASVTQRRTDGGTHVSTYTSTSGVILPQPVIGMPKLSLIVDLQQCTYRVVTSASVATLLTDEFGNQINSVDIITQIQFAGPVPSDWRMNGIGQANGTMGGHSIFWSGLNANESALMPLGFAVELFEGSPNEPPVGQASGGFHLDYSP